MSEMMTNDKINQFEDVKLGRECIGYLFVIHFLGEWGRENERSYKCMKWDISLENVKKSSFRLKCFLFLHKH